MGFFVNGSNLFSGNICWDGLWKRTMIRLDTIRTGMQEYRDARIPRCSMYGIFTYIWVIYVGQMLVNIPAPWFAYGIWFVFGTRNVGKNSRIEWCLSEGSQQSLDMPRSAPWASPRKVCDPKASGFLFFIDEFFLVKFSCVLATLIL